MRDLLSNFEEDHRSLGYGSEVPTYRERRFSWLHAIAAILILGAAIFIGGHGLV
ncbi:hypothetical protein FHT78_000524 [Rhizobium sp. BK196]|jgi:hypothetical protein|uniref:Uncharacterized protein n=1 Tax=Rhizobium mesosinicum TaxID=335017 RepID=A0ABS7H079_9HYPH|nr:MULTISPECIES: hypothetical protein [Rhizobium]MBB3308795.1 hypothetical protein [Rhizobium sp. BK196]MBB3461628.1 hypothetical protein [Rhizobium sp. BK377]MBW9054774.1 hypothetical protein [Rhizobium mesosinicum]